MLRIFHWLALIAVIVFVVAIAGMIVSSQPPSRPHHQQTTTESETKQTDEKNDKTLWDSWFPDSISLYTLFLVVFTGVLAIAGLTQLKFLERAEIIAANASDAARKSADTSREALVKSQRAFIRFNGFPWLWRPDFSRPGKYFYDITPIIENAGATPTVDMTIAADSILLDASAPDGFDFPYRGNRGNTLIGPHQTIGANNAIILDDDLLAIQNGTKFFYVYGTITYRDVFNGTPVHTTEYCFQITRVLGNPLDPRDPAVGPKATSVEITFGIYKEHHNAD